MKKLTRRGFITRTSAGVAAISALGSLPILSGAGATPVAQAQGREDARRAPQGLLVAHVRNSATGEIAVCIGTREVVVHDPELVQRLILAVQ